MPSILLLVLGIPAHSGSWKVNFSLQNDLYAEINNNGQNDTVEKNNSGQNDTGALCGAPVVAEEV